MNRIIFLIVISLLVQYSSIKNAYAQSDDDSNTTQRLKQKDKSHHQPIRFKDPWLEDPKGAPEPKEPSVVIDNKYIFKIKDDAISQTCKLLDNDTFVPLTIDQAKKLTNSKIKVEKGLAPYLIRSITIDWGTEGITVILCDNGYVIIGLSALGEPDETVVVKHKPIIVLLRRKPIYVGICNPSFAL